MPTVDEDLTTLGTWLARRDVGTAGEAGADVLVLCGSAVLPTVTLAADAVHDGAVPRILVTGGTGHSTAYLLAALRAHPRWYDAARDGRPEAELLADVLVRHLGVPAAAVATETASTNCGENASLSLRALAADGGVRRLLLVQDPTMQRRTHASVEHHRGADGPEVLSLAPFVPVVGREGAGDGSASWWSRRRFASLATGEVRRLRDDEHGYGPRGAGFLGHVEVPAGVEAADRRLRVALVEELGQAATGR